MGPSAARPPCPTPPAGVSLQGQQCGTPGPLRNRCGRHPPHCQASHTVRRHVGGRRTVCPRPDHMCRRCQLKSRSGGVRRQPVQLDCTLTAASQLCKHGRAFSLPFKAPNSQSAKLTTCLAAIRPLPPWELVPANNSLAPLLTPLTTPQPLLCAGLQWRAACGGRRCAYGFMCSHCLLRQAQCVF